MIDIEKMEMKNDKFDTPRRTMAKAYDLFNNDGGCSFLWRKRKMALITNGHMVGGASKEVTIASDKIDVRLFSYMWDYFTDTWSALAEDGGSELCLGLWKNPSNGNLVMSQSTWHGDEGEAVAIAISRGQRAYHDIDRNKTVYVL